MVYEMKYLCSNFNIKYIAKELKEYNEIIE